MNRIERVVDGVDPGLSARLSPTRNEDRCVV
jgi:hypothetical protein